MFENKCPIKIDIKNNKTILTDYVFTQGDVDFNYFEFTLYDNNKLLQVDESITYTISFLKQDGTTIKGEYDRFTLDTENNKILYKLGTSEISYPGWVEATLELYSNESRFTTCRFKYHTSREIGDENSFSSVDEYPLYIQFLSAADNEDQRITNEQGRVESENLRKQEHTQAMTDINSKISETNTAIEKANTEANNASNQAEHAKTQGDYAKEQGDIAYSKIDEIDTKVSEVTTATTNANDSANLANTKAQLADEKANLAQAKADLANANALLAEEKATLADTKANEANQAAQSTLEVKSSVETLENEVSNNENIRESNELNRESEFNNIKNDWNNLTTQQQQDAEVVSARGGYGSLDDRLDNESKYFWKEERTINEGGTTLTLANPLKITDELWVTDETFNAIWQEGVHFNKSGQNLIFTSEMPQTLKFKIYNLG